MICEIVYERSTLGDIRQRRKKSKPDRKNDGFPQILKHKTVDLQQLEIFNILNVFPYMKFFQ